MASKKLVFHASFVLFLWLKATGSDRSDELKGLSDHRHVGRDLCLCAEPVTKCKSVLLSVRVT